MYYCQQYFERQAASKIKLTISTKTSMGEEKNKLN